MDDEIRAVLAAHGRLSIPVESLSDDTDLYGAGLSSHACINVMLALEDSFDLQFPDELLRRDTFGSIAALRSALSEIAEPADR
jgi:acyl carrier protein